MGWGGGPDMVRDGREEEAKWLKSERRSLAMAVTRVFGLVVAPQRSLFSAHTQELSMVMNQSITANYSYREVVKRKK